MKKIILFALILLITCASPRSNFTTKEDSRISLNVTTYPKIPGLIFNTTKPSIVIVGPILFKPASLFRIDENKEYGLIPYLNKEGYDVYLINNRNEKVDFDLQAIELQEIIQNVVTVSRNENIILGGTSVGGQVIFNFLKNDFGQFPTYKIKKLFFIGTGVDYNYPSNFVDNEIDSVNKKANQICNDNIQNNFCEKYITEGNINENYQYNSNNLKEKFVNYKNFKKEMFQFLPKISKNALAEVPDSVFQIPTFVAYGKIDNVSPEESVFPLIQKINPKNFGLWDRTKIFFKETFTKYKEPLHSKVLEMSIANSKSQDYDHADLFMYEKKGWIFTNRVEYELYKPLTKWLDKE